MSRWRSSRTRSCSASSSWPRRASCSTSSSATCRRPGENSVKFLRGLTTEELGRAVPLLAADAAALGCRRWPRAGGAESLPFRTWRSATITAIDDRSDDVRGEGERIRARVLLRRVRHCPGARPGDQGEQVGIGGQGQGRGSGARRQRHCRTRTRCWSSPGSRTTTSTRSSTRSTWRSCRSRSGTLVSSDRRFLDALGVGALMHDIGKLTVELEVLNKPGGLSPEEWELMRLHPVYGAELAATMPGLDRASHRRHPRAPHALRPGRVSRTHAAAAPAPHEPHLCDRRRLRRDDVAAHVLGGATAGRGDGDPVQGHRRRRSTRCSCACSCR